MAKKTKYVVRLKTYCSGYCEWVIFSTEKKRTIAECYYMQRSYDKDLVIARAKQFSKDSGIPYSDKILRGGC